MCVECFDEADLPAARTFSVGQLAETARLIEQDIAGEPVPPDAWSIYFGRASGAIDWRSMDRIMRSMDAANLLLSMVTPGPTSSSSRD